VRSSEQGERERERERWTTGRKETELEYDSINPAIERVEWQADGEASVPVDESKRGGNDERVKGERGREKKKKKKTMTMTVKFRVSQSRSTNCQVRTDRCLCRDCQGHDGGRGGGRRERRTRERKIVGEPAASGAKSLAISTAVLAISMTRSVTRGSL